IMLEELFNEGPLKPGQKILCMVPESGRFVVSFIGLTVTGAESAAEKIRIDTDKSKALTPDQEPDLTDADLQGSLMRRLAQVWVDFEIRINRTSIVDKLNRGKLRIEDYRLLLLNLRQQVVDGARWIARGASNITIEHFSLRSMFIGHAGEESRDYQMIERDYLAVGGSLEEIQRAEKNIGSEALSAWMFHRAGQENPFDLLGAMFIIEGLGA